LIVVGENTNQLARHEFLMRELDWVQVKGAKKTMTIYQPIAELNRATDAQKDLVSRFSQALGHYRQRRFEEAYAIWNKLTAEYEPAPSPSSAMADRARELIAKEPPGVWNAVNVLLSK
jgi:hypothetical protein